MSEKKRIASIEDPTFEAIAEGMFRFEREAQANSLLARLAKQFVISKDQLPPVLKLWIRGFGVSEEEKKQGYYGHFARLTPTRLEGGKVTIIAAKLDVPLKLHPQKGREKQRHPNWGHPILRAAQRGKLYPAIEKARTELLKLHEEFPEASIPGRDKLHVMVYTRQSMPPIAKCTLIIAAVAEQGFRLEVKESAKRTKEEVAAAQETEAPEAEPQTGKFTSMVSLSRKKKPVRKTRKPKEDSEE